MCHHQGHLGTSVDHRCANANSAAQIWFSPTDAEDKRVPAFGVVRRDLMISEESNGHSPNVILRYWDPVDRTRLLLQETAGDCQTKFTSVIASVEESQFESMDDSDYRQISAEFYSQCYSRVVQESPNVTCEASDIAVRGTSIVS